MTPFSWIGAIIGGLVGVMIWCVAMVASGEGWGGLALLVGAGVGAGAVFCGAAPRGALAASIITLLLCICAKGVGYLVVGAFERDRQTGALSFTEADYTRFMDDAAEFTTVQPGDYERFMVGRPKYDTNVDGVISPAERERFERFWAPRLRQWAQTPPAYMDWAPQLRQDWAPEMVVRLEPRAVILELFPLWSLVAMAVAVAMAHLSVQYMGKEEVDDYDRDNAMQAGIIDLNADIGTRINIQMAAPGQKAGRVNAKITDRVMRAKAGRPTGQVRKPPPPRSTLRDQPPGMK